MTENIPTVQANRRDLLKGGALGLGTLAGGLSLSGVSPSLAAAADPLTGAPMAAVAAAGSSPYFLNIAGIPGESLDEKHPDWIDVLSYSWGASSAGGKATVTDLFVASQLSQASPQLFLAAMNTRSIATATLEGVRPSADSSGAPFMRLALENVVVTAYQTGAADEIPFDTFSLSFGRISYSYWRQTRDGSPGVEQVVRWDVKAGKAF